MALKHVEESLAVAMQPRLASAVSYCDKLADVRRAYRLTIVLDGSLDQAVTVQVVGNPRANSPTSGLVNIGASVSLAVGSTAAVRRALGVDLTAQYYPWVGVTVTAGSTPPTAGQVQILAIHQDDVEAAA